MFKKVVKSIFDVLKHIFLFFLYCSSTDKYSGETYEEWLNKGK